MYLSLPWKQSFDRVYDPIFGLGELLSKVKHYNPPKATLLALIIIGTLGVEVKAEEGYKYRLGQIVPEGGIHTMASRLSTRLIKSLKSASVEKDLMKEHFKKDHDNFTNLYKVFENRMCLGVMKFGWLK